MSDIDPKNTDTNNTAPSQSDGLGVLLSAVAVVLLVLCPLIWVGYDHFYIEPYRKATESPIRPPANAPSIAHGESLEEYEARLNGTYYYDPETPASKLAKLYTDALAKSVKDKDTTACQTGLKKFRTQIEDMPMAVLIDLDENYSTNGWEIPTRTTFLTADHLKYACQQATRLDLMSDLKVSNSGLQALQAIDSDDVILLKNGPKVCFDILSKDYRQAVGRSTAADRVMLGLTSLMLPKELSDEQFATLCDYSLDKKA